MFRNVASVIFDMDGTLVDSEGYAEQCVLELLEAHGLPAPEQDLTDLHGVTWALCEEMLRHRYAALRELDLVESLRARFCDMIAARPPTFLPGAEQALQEACAELRGAIVTSSNREVVELLLQRLPGGGDLSIVVSAEDCARSKPDPECYLLAACLFEVAPERCLVFEDSLAGLQAAKAAGMQTVGVQGARASMGRAAAYADMTIRNYRELPAGFFASLGC